jgi:heptosyltransferase I
VIPPTALQSTNEFDRLLIVRLGSMGDILHTLPAAAALRQAFPDALIGWIVEERWADLLCTASEPRSGPLSARKPIVNKIHTVNTKQWRHSPFSVQTWERVAATLSELRAQHYQAAVDFQGAVRSALLARWSSAPFVYGARQPRESVASMFYTREIDVAGGHIVQQNLRLAEAVAHRSLKIRPVGLPCDPTAEQSIERWLQSKNLTEFVLLSPGAGWGAKQWPAERFGQVAKALAKQGTKSLINFGPGEESLAQAAEVASQGAAESLQCSLVELIALTRRARLFIGGDTGPMHLAAALRIPVVAIFGPTDPVRNGPFAARSRVLRSSLSRTSLSHRYEPDPGLLQIIADHVVAAAQELLGETIG